MRGIANTRRETLAEESRRRSEARELGPSRSDSRCVAAAQTGTFRSPSALDGGRAQRDAERRRYDRYAVRCECWLEHDDATVYGQAADLGMGGLFLRTAVPVASGRHLDIVLVFGHEAQRVYARGIVTRTVPAERGRRHGLGIELTHVFEGAEALEKLGLNGS